MNRFLNKWLVISFFNLCLVAFLGVVLRYKIAFYLPFVQQKFLLHSHSHFAFSGWVTQTLMVLLIHHLSLQSGEQILKKYRWLLNANLFVSYGMLISFMAQGYSCFSVAFSTLSILISYFFTYCYWRDLNKLAGSRVSSMWIKAALALHVISSLGTFFLAYTMASKHADQHLYLASVYFYLHFQYNGWFLFAGMGLLTSRFEKIAGSFKKLRTIFLLFFLASFPAYFLSVLWLPLSGFVYSIILAAVVFQLSGWVLMLRFFLTNRDFIRRTFSKHGRFLLLLAAIAFSIKILLQSGSVHPALSQLSYSFRPIIIGYLHLVLLAVTSIFIIGYISAFELVGVTKKLLTGSLIFVAGAIINELLLMIQGVGALEYKGIPHINALLLLAALILLTGAGVMFSGLTGNPNSHHPEN
jgi:hypothetical protein